MNKLVIVACCVWLCRAGRPVRALRMSDTFAAVPLHAPLPVMHVLTAVPAAAPSHHQHQHRAPSPTQLTPYFFYYPKPPPPSRLPYSFSAYGERVPTGKPSTLNEVAAPRYPEEVYELSHIPSRLSSRYSDEGEEPQEEVESLEAQYSAAVAAARARPRAPARPRRRPARPARASPSRSPVHVTTEAPVIIRIHKYRITKTNQ